MYYLEKKNYRSRFKKKKKKRQNYWGERVKPMSKKNKYIL